MLHQLYGSLLLYQSLSDTRVWDVMLNYIHSTVARRARPKDFDRRNGNDVSKNPIMHLDDRNMKSLGRWRSGCCNWLPIDPLVRKHESRVLSLARMHHPLTTCLQPRPSWDFLVSPDLNNLAIYRRGICSLEGAYLTGIMPTNSIAGILVGCSNPQHPLKIGTQQNPREQILCRLVQQHTSTFIKW